MQWSSSHPQEPTWLLNLKAYEKDIEAFFQQAFENTPPPALCSTDVRFAGYKMAPVDTNVFPAGLNNLHIDDLPHAAQCLHQHLRQRLQSLHLDINSARIGVVPENHTRNGFYHEHLGRLMQLLEQSGIEARLLSVRDDLQAVETISTPSGGSLTYHPFPTPESHWQPDWLLLNHDGSGSIPKGLENLTLPCDPPLNMTWSIRKKSTHFQCYRAVIHELIQHIDLDPWRVSTAFKQCHGINFKTAEGMPCIAHHCATLLKQLHQEVARYNLSEQPFLAVKADQGTYGMGVMMVDDDQALLSLNRKKRSHMSSQKGGGQVDSALIQEGIPSAVSHAGQTAEVVVYLSGATVIGGFYRKHEHGGDRDNLNGPGMSFEPIPLEALSPETAYGYAYSVIARCAALAAAREMVFG